MRGRRWLRVLLAFSIVTALATMGGQAQEQRPAAAYLPTDLPTIGPAYCHPQMNGTIWPNQPANCAGTFTISSVYPCCNGDGSFINYQGMNFSRPTIGLTQYGSLSSPPSFVVTATPAPDGTPDGAMRIYWERLAIGLPGAFDPRFMYADPVTTCGPAALSCIYRLDQDSLLNAMATKNIGDPPTWTGALIEVPVNTGEGCCALYGWGSIAIGFYRTDNKAPVADAIVTANDDEEVSFHFNAGNSFDPDDEPIVRYHWNFGDGTSADGKVVDHTYAAEGAYTAKLFVLDDDGAQSELSIDLGSRMDVKLEAGALPQKDGDKAIITATLTNNGSRALRCMLVSRTPDIRPKTSFTEISRPPAYVDNLIPRGGSVTGTWVFELEGDPPEELYFFATGFGGGGGPDCPGTNRESVSVDRTWDLDGPQPWSPFANWAALVKRQYNDVINRDPTSSESSSWVTKLNAATHTSGDLVTSLRTSTDNTTNVDPTARLYRALLGRTPDKSGLTFWIGRRRAGTWTLVKMADYFAASSEFKRKYGTLTNRQFVTRIYTDVLGRTADTAGVDYWTRQLDLGRRSRGSVMVGFSESNEYTTKQRANTDAVAAYLFLLKKVPNATELSTWATARANGTPHEDLLDQILDSAAYKALITTG